MAHGNEANERTRARRGKVSGSADEGAESRRNAGTSLGTKACLQPFRFTDLSDLDRENLQSDLAGFLGTGSFAAEN